MVFKKYKYITVVLLLLLFWFCKKDFLKPAWDIDVVSPVIKSNLTIQNIVDDSLINIQADSSITIVYTTDLLEFDLDTLIKIPDTAYNYSASLDNLELADQTMSYPITLAEMAHNAGWIGEQIIASHGQMSIIPPVDGISSGGMPIDANNFFQSVTLLEGFMDIKFINGLPIKITNFIFAIKNQSDATTIISDTIAEIPAKDSLTKTYDLAGKIIDGDLVAEIINIDSPGSEGNDVLIDTTDALIINLCVRDLKPIEATAVFPAQDLFNKHDRMLIKLGGIDLKEIVLQTGQVNIKAVNTIDDSLRFSYNVPGASLNQTSFMVNDIISPASSQAAVHYNKSYDISGYKMLLTGKNHDTINSLHQHLIGSIDSTGEVKTMTLNDSIVFTYEMKNLIPNYAKGYLGKHAVNINNDTAKNTIFNNIISGTLNAKSVNIFFSVENYIGADASIIFNSIEALNSKTGENKTLQSTFLGKHNHINRANSPVFGTINSTLYQFEINNSNSNITQLINLMPDNFIYNIDIDINPLGNISGGNDFLYTDKTIKANLNIELPLNLFANNLHLKDTIDISINESNNDNIIGMFVLKADNLYPINANVQLLMYDKMYNCLDTIIVNQTIKHAHITNGIKATVPKHSEITIPISKQKMQALNNTEHIVLDVIFNTLPTNQHIRIYSDYFLNLQLVGNFNYQINN